MSKAKKKYSINITAIICAVIIAVAGVAITIIGAGSNWFRNSDITTWFGLGKKPTAAVLAIDSNGAELKDGSAVGMSRGITYLFSTYSEQTAEGIKETEYIPEGELTMSAELSNPFVKAAFDWSVNFANSSEEWASGKTAADYVSVTPLIDGSNTAKVKLLQSFSSQIIITATLRGSEQADTCTVDCLKCVQYEVASANFGGSDFGDGIEFDISYNYVGGTVKSEDFRLNYLKIELDNGFINAFKSYLNFDVDITDLNLPATDWKSTTDEYPNGDVLKTAVYFESGLSFEQSNFITGFDSYDKDHKEAIYYAWWQAYKSHTYNVKMSFSIDYLYAGYTVSSYEETDIVNDLRLTGDADGYYIKPNVTLNKNYVL